MSTRAKLLAMWIRKHRCSYFALPQSYQAIVAILVLVSCGRIGFDSSEFNTQSDAAPVDAAIAQTYCSSNIDTSLVALYTFDQDVGNGVVDALGANPGTLVGSVAHTAGPFSECGQGTAL